MLELCVSGLAVVVLVGVLAVAYRIREASQEAEFRKTNPEIWLRKQELEEAEKQRRHERMQAGMKTGGAIGKIVLRKYLGK